jgi:hypothetical protein
LLAEYGVVLPKGLRYLRAQVPLILEDAEQPLTVVARDFIHRLYVKGRFLQAVNRWVCECEAKNMIT